MNQDDPFGNYLDDDKTVMKPTPGRQRAPSSELPDAIVKPVSEAIPEQTVSSQALSGSLEFQAGKNPLVNSAAALLSLVSQLRNTTTHPDVPGLRNRIIGEVKAFEANALQHGCSAEQTQVARYALCALVDEAVLNTPWGGNSIWPTQNLLVTFHKESWGGEKFFQVLSNLIAQPGIYLHLLDLFYFCLSLGFEGKYKVMDQGASKLEAVRENLYQVIRRQKGEFDRELSSHWQGITDNRHALIRYVPLWVVSSVAGLLLMFVFLGFLFAVNQASNPLLGQLYKIKDSMNAYLPDEIKNAPESTPTIPDTRLIDDVRTFLQPEIQQGKVTVDDLNGKIVVRIMAKSFFASGSDNVQDQYFPLLERISQALTTVPGRISVVGHTDNVPIFTARFPSNWDLSNARAKTVANFLSNNTSLMNKVTSEGRADTQSLVPNDSPEHRAMNRRIEIIF
ncbi:MAG: type VI secretion system protein TssL [Methylococcaceae bacterium]|nr:type VI secretion system protein TssL [Methylococcaceae bacterium]